MIKSAVALVLFAACVQAQAVSAQNLVSASGQATVSVAPDTAKVDVSMNATGSSAAAAASKNAGQVTAVQAALTKLLGAGADIKTVNYFVGPTSSLTGVGNLLNGGYTASSTLEITLTNLSLAGTVIDTAVGAGATSVGGVQFLLVNSDTAHNQALTAATKQALAHANAMAAAAGRSVGTVVTIQEVAAPAAIYAGLSAIAPIATTVTPGLIQVQVNVTVQAQLN